MGDNDHILDVVADEAKMDRYCSDVEKTDPDRPTRRELAADEDPRL